MQELTDLNFLESSNEDADFQYKMKVLDALIQEELSKLYKPYREIFKKEND